MSQLSNSEPTFTRSEVAKILNVTPLTIANREKANRKGIRRYPEPRRDLNNYRIYSISDVLNLQLITFKAMDPKPIMSVLYDKGYRDHKKLGQMIDAALDRRRGTS